MTNAADTPTDAPPRSTSKRKAASEKSPRESVPQRGIRKRVLGSGEGDYCIYEIATSGSDFPAGSLLPIPDVPRFEATTEAVRWIKNESGDLLTGKQVMIFRAMEIMTIQVASRPTIEIISKPKVVVNDPTASAQNDG